MSPPSSLAEPTPAPTPRTIVVVAPPATHAAIRARFQPATTVELFGDGEVQTALARVFDAPPSVVAIESQFSCSIGGRSLINTLLGNPSLAGAEIRVVTRSASAAAPFDLDPACRRTGERHRAKNVDVQLDGTATRLVDLSARGAQVLSRPPLKPNQRLRVVLSTATPDVVRLEATVVWASFEMPPGLPTRYRAGLEFAGVPAVLKNVADFVARVRAGV